MAQEGPYADHQPWQILSARPGIKGLVLAPGNNLDALTVDHLARMVNLEQRFPGPLQVRPGQVLQATLGGAIHSGGRAADPSSGTVLRAWGVGSTCVSQGGTVFQSGLSGRPLTFVPFYTQISDEPWLVVADATGGLFKIRVSDGLVLPVGLAAPGAPTAAISDLLTTRFAAFDSSDGTQAANWTATAGIDTSDTPGTPDAPAISDIGGVSGSAIQLLTAPGSAVGGYSSIGGVPIAVNASVLQGGAFPAADEDLVHVWVRMDLPALISEVRVYLVCAAGFDPSVVPGTSDVANQDAYVKAFRPNDWTLFLEQTAPATTQGQVIRDNLLTEQFQEGESPEDPRLLNPGDVVAAQQIGRQTSTEVGGGRNVWTELGIVGLPLRRGEWARIGTAEDRDWATLTGLVVVVITNAPSAVTVALDDFFLTGGFGPDTSDPGTSAYTYYATDYDPRTGAESNGTVMSTDPGVNPARQRVTVQPQAAADGGLRQRVYREGGTLPGQILFIGETTSNGGQVVDTLSDGEIAAAPTIPEDHFQPVPATDDDGSTALHSPCPTIFGPLDDMVFAVGNALQPGTLFACITGEIDHWADDLAIPVCPSSEQLMNGITGWGSAGWVFSREQLYAIYVNQVAAEGQTITTQPTGCKPGLAARMGLCLTPRGIAYVASDGIRLTQGGGSTLVGDEQIRYVFAPGSQTSCEGVTPIDWTQPEKINLAYHSERLWLTYQSLGAAAITTGPFPLAAIPAALTTLRYDFLTETCDGPQVFGAPLSCVLPEPATATAAAQLLMGSSSGAVSLLGGTTDNTAAIPFDLKTGAWDMGLPAVTKSLGDVQPEMDVPTGTPLRLTLRLNNDIATNPVQTINGLEGRRRYQFTPFGQEPQRARNLTTQLTGTTSAGGSFHQLHASYIPEPLTTTARPSPWESFPPGQGYLIGCRITADTAGVAVPTVVEVNAEGSAIVAAATLNCLHFGRRVVFYSWPAVIGTQARVRPSTACGVWILYDIHWIYAPEPGRLAYWDSTIEHFGDTYYTGLDVECNTYGLEKTIEVLVDGVIVLTTTVTTSVRALVHVTLPPGYGHLYQFRATDANTGSLYTHKWRLETVPGEQSNWNQPITPYGTNADKYLKALVIRCDTFNLPKTLDIQANGTTAHTITVTAGGLQVVMAAFAPILGRVFRVLPTDDAPGRCWEIEPIFDEEPLQLDRWETQRIDHGITGWHMLLRGFVTIRAASDVLLTLTSYNQTGQVVQAQVYTIPASAGAKVKHWVPFEAAKGVLYHWLFASADPFFLYREECAVIVQVWGGGQEYPIKPFGTDDMDHVRQRQPGPGYPEIPATPVIPPVS